MIKQPNSYFWDKFVNMSSCELHFKKAIDYVNRQT